jgi:phenylalanyl-tRNA synthetase alpha chain
MPYTVPKLTNFSATAVGQAGDEFLKAFQDEKDEVERLAKSPDASIREKHTALDNFRNRWVSRARGLFAQANEYWLKAAPKQDKKYAGQRINSIDATLSQGVESLQQHVGFWAQASRQTLTRFPASDVESHNLQSVVQVRIAAERLDITLPGIRRPIGAEHPVIKTMNEIVAVFRNLGYSVEEGPEIETDYYNFEALNFPPNHPARDTQDTLFIAGQESKPLRDRLLLRTHTSPVQIRTMEKMKPPVRVVCPGKVHRNDALDATHSPIFHQVEGLAVDTNITFCDLKGTLDHAMKALFGSSVKTRFYPSFFPFTEPSADVQISCIFCDGKGVRDGAPCRNCKASGWIELLGCGMVDPNVYGFVDYDASKVSGFAFGMGVERIAILKYGVDDIQLFFQGDVRFLEQFG